MAAPLIIHGHLMNAALTTAKSANTRERKTEGLIAGCTISLINNNRTQETRIPVRENVASKPVYLPERVFYITYQVKYLIEILAFPNTLIKHLSVSKIPEMTLFTGRDGCFLCVSQTVSKTFVEGSNPSAPALMYFLVRRSVLQSGSFSYAYRAVCILSAPPFRLMLML